MVAAPGAQADYFKNGNPDGKSRREILGKPIKSLPAFRDPVERLKVMDDLGLVDEAIRELDYVVERGARVILVRPAPVQGLISTRSPALPEFDPFWAKVAEAGLLVGMHASDSGYQKYINEWEGIRTGEMLPFRNVSGFQQIMQHFSRPVVDTVTSLIAHGLCTRFPTLRFAPVENGSSWVRPLLDAFEHAYFFAPNAFEENPIDVFMRNIVVHPFHEEDTIGLCRLLGSERVIFGSDWPHPEGLADPLSFVDELEGLSDQDQAKVMGGNLAQLLHLEAA